MEPASSIVRKLGGPSSVAAIVGVHRTRVSNWSRPKAAGGTGGLIPLKYATTLIAAAAERGIEITADEFMPVSDPPRETVEAAE